VQGERQTSVRQPDHHSVSAVVRPERLGLLQPRSRDLTARRRGESHGVAAVPEARPEHEEGSVVELEQVRSVSHIGIQKPPARFHDSHSAEGCQGRQLGPRDSFGASSDCVEDDRLLYSPTAGRFVPVGSTI
jgi:hypothetical protein